MDEIAKGNADRDQLIPTVLRFANRKESKNILDSFYRSLRTGYHCNPQGIYVRKQSSVVEGDRLDRFAKRIVKALFYREKGHRLPDGYTVNAIHQTRLKDVEQDSKDSKEFLGFILMELIQKSVLQSWGEVFAYSWVQSPNDHENTWWLLDFYGVPYYLCSTCPEAANRKRSIDQSST